MVFFKKTLVPIFTLLPSLNNNVSLRISAIVLNYKLNAISIY